MESIYGLPTNSYVDRWMDSEAVKSRAACVFLMGVRWVGREGQINARGREGWVYMNVCKDGVHRVGCGADACSLLGRAHRPPARDATRRTSLHCLRCSSAGCVIGVARWPVGDRFVIATRHSGRL